MAMSRRGRLSVDRGHACSSVEQNRRVVHGDVSHLRPPCPPVLRPYTVINDELDLVASSEVRHNPNFFLTNPRPSMLRDYFDPRLHKVIQSQRRLRQITVSFEIDEAYVPALS